jgi:hypothetical protein
MLPGVDSEYLLTDIEYDLWEYYETFEQINPLYGNFVNKKASLYYATVVTNSTLQTVIPPDQGIGGTPSTNEAEDESGGGTTS